MNNELIPFLINCQIAVWIRHWQTTNYAEHKALGEVYAMLGEFTDTYVEARQGADSARINFMQPANIELANYSKDDVVELLRLLESQLNSFNWGGAAFVNMKDEFVAKLNQQQYLLSLV
jgi:hypothetical protein